MTRECLRDAYREEIEYTPAEFTEAGDAVVVGVLYEGRGKGSRGEDRGQVLVLVQVP